MDEIPADDVKEMVRARDGHRCKACGLPQGDHLATYGKALEVHRLIPGSAYSLAGCETLCIPCHGKRAKSPPWATIRALAVHLPPDLAEAVRAYVDSQIAASGGATFFARRLCRLREERGLSRYALAKRIKEGGRRLSAQAIANLEGGAEPSFATAQLLASALDVPLATFLDPDEPPEISPNTY